jgi:hypothetical protein
MGPTNPHWARVVSYGLFSLCVIHKEGLCPSSGDIDWLIMMMGRHGIPARVYEAYLHIHGDELSAQAFDLLAHSGPGVEGPHGGAHAARLRRRG